MPFPSTFQAWKPQHFNLRTFQGLYCTNPDSAFFTVASFLLDSLQPLTSNDVPTRTIRPNHISVSQVHAAVPFVDFVCRHFSTPGIVWAHNCSRGGSRICQRRQTMASAWSASGSRDRAPGWGSEGRSPLKLKAFLVFFHTKRGEKLSI